MSIVTKTGDQGTTSLCGRRVYKDVPVIEAIGSVDELNAHLGLLGEEKLQLILFRLGSELAGGKKKVTEEDLAFVEELIREEERRLPPQTGFILPKNQWHVVRAVCRRAERACVRCGLRGTGLIFLNRLSDYLFLRGYEDCPAEF